MHTSYFHTLNLGNITTTSTMHFEGGINNLEQEKTREARHFFQRT